MGLREVRNLRLTAEADLSQHKLELQNMEMLQEKEPTEVRKEQIKMLGFLIVEMQERVDNEKTHEDKLESDNKIKSAPRRPQGPQGKGGVSRSEARIFYSRRAYSLRAANKRFANGRLITLIQFEIRIFDW